jgi:hypothetical protein
MFQSKVEEGIAVRFPKFRGIRVMMMPFLVEDPIGTLPENLYHYATMTRDILNYGADRGVGYITIDESLVKTGETHRRPGLHVDGIGPDGRAAPYGGGGGYAARGMYLAASVKGCRGWNKVFKGWPGLNGDCAHLSDQCRPEDAIPFEANTVYWCSPLAVHEPLQLAQDTPRQFLRVSMPSDAPWHEGYTENPLGIKPGGPIEPPRVAEMSYRR